MKTRAVKNHVIFLGAGASKSSGYPLGESLRLRLSCRNQFQRDFLRAIGEEFKDDAEVKRECFKHFDAFGSSIDLFRKGGFASVDEFSKLMSKDHPGSVQDMKRLMRLALSFHNPEDDFSESDYYPFIQRLFDDENLQSLKSHVTILSYNYDCYLDFLLLRAYKHRQALAGHAVIEEFYENKLTSGFHNPHDIAWADQIADFNYYKLHGSIVPMGKWDFSNHNLFSTSPFERVKLLATDYYKVTTPPIVFPWELFDSAGNFVKEDNFIFVKKVTDRKKESEGRMLFRLYQKIWEGARATVQNAKKISFIGLSAHPYMNAGLKYLFNGKQGEVQTVVANPENQDFKDSKNRLHPGSLCGRMSNLLNHVAPDMKYVKSFCEDDGVLKMKDFEDAKAGVWNADITPRYSFKDFIRTEID